MWKLVATLRCDDGLFSPALSRDPIVRDRFLREARLLARVDVQCTARVLAADVDADPAYVAIEYVEGLTLQRHVEKFTGRFPQHLLRLLAVGLLEALVAVHGKGIVHRDLKPPTSS